MNTEDKKKQLEKRKSDISTELLNKKAEILNKETELKKINTELEKLKKINYEYVETDLKNIQSEISMLIENYNVTAKNGYVPVLGCFVVLDQKPESDPYYDPANEEEIPEILAFDIHERVHNIEVFPKNIEQIFHNRGWFPSDFC